MSKKIHPELNEMIHNIASHNNEISGGNSPKKLKVPRNIPSPSKKHVHFGESVLATNQKQYITADNHVIKPHDYSIKQTRPLKDPATAHKFSALYARDYNNYIQNQHK